MKMSNTNTRNKKSVVDEDILATATFLYFVVLRRIWLH